MSNLDIIQFHAPPYGDESVFEDMEVAVENYNNATDPLEKLKYLKYIYEKFFDYLKLEKNDGVLLALLETSRFFVAEKHKLQFDRETYTLKCPFYRGDRLLFRPVDLKRLSFSCFNCVNGEYISNVIELTGTGSHMDVSVLITGKTGRKYEVNYNPDGTIDTYLIKEYDNAMFKVIQNVTYCYEEGYIKVVLNGKDSKYYDFSGKEKNFHEKSSSVKFNVIFSPLIPYFGRDLSKRACIELDEKTIGVLFPNLKCNSIVR